MSKFLEKIESPAYIRNLTVSQLKELAGEVRDVIIRQVATKGGHLSSNLGTVELAICLHKVYNTPEDKLVWDTGHQAYPHKLLTGRYNNFSTLKQYGGISGFLKRTESEFDTFGAGHASTSLSAAMGFAVARTLSKKSHHVVGIIGDGALTGGMAYEAMNNAGELNEDITFVLNDNRMSIAPNVGAMSKYLTQIISNPTYNKLKGDIWGLTKKLPASEGLRKIASKMDESVKHFMLPGGLFEDLGLRYFGPIDGHNIETLIETFEAVKKVKGPKLVHVVSRKGQGWELSEQDSIKWHAPTAFDPESGKPLKKSGPIPNYTRFFGEALLEVAKEDQDVVAITGAMPSGCGVDIMKKEIPERVFDVGIAEPYAVTFAAGLACEGKKPVVAIYSTFLQRAIDQIIHDVAIQKLNVIFALDRAGLVGADGPTHHGAMDLTYLRMIPGMVIMAPSDEQELRNAFYTAIKWNKGPIALRYPRGLGKGLKLKPGFEALEIGKPNVLRNGHGLVILAVGQLLPSALSVAEKLFKEGINPTVVDPRFIKPFHKKSWLDLLSRHSAVVTLEENVISGGFGSAVSEFMAENDLHIPCKHIGLPDSFVTHGDIPSLYREIGLDEESLYKKINAFIKINLNGKNDFSSVQSRALA